MEEYKQFWKKINPHVQSAYHWMIFLNYSISLLVRGVTYKYKKYLEDKTPSDPWSTHILQTTFPKFYIKF